MNSALPMPVPNVSIMTTPRSPRPAPKRISATPAASASSGKGQLQTEGLVVVSGPAAGRTDKQVLQALVEEFGVPEQHKFGLLHRIRVAEALVDADKRFQMLRIRLLALSALVHLFPEDVSQSKIFLYEPDLSHRLVDIVMAADISRDLQAIAIGGLEAIAHLRGHLSEVMSGLNATANLGPLMSILRKTLAALDTDGKHNGRDGASPLSH